VRAFARHASRPQPNPTCFGDTRDSPYAASRCTVTMAFMIDDAFLPATLTAHPMTDEEFAGFCAGHPDLFFEMTGEGEIIVMPPAYSLKGPVAGFVLDLSFVWNPLGV
jgi:hypothetical protein